MIAFRRVGLPRIRKKPLRSPPWRSSSTGSKLSALPCCTCFIQKPTDELNASSASFSLPETTLFQPTNTTLSAMGHLPSSGWYTHVPGDDPEAGGGQQADRAAGEPERVGAEPPEEQRPQARSQEGRRRPRHDEGALVAA